MWNPKKYIKEYFGSWEEQVEAAEYLIDLTKRLTQLSGLANLVREKQKKVSTATLVEIIKDEAKAKGRLEVVNHYFKHLVKDKKRGVDKTRIPSYVKEAMRIARELEIKYLDYVTINSRCFLPSELGEEVGEE